MLAAIAQPLFALLLGPSWDQAAILFSLLAIAGIAQAIGKVRGWLFITMGRSHQQFFYDLVARPLVVAGFFVGIWWGGIYGLALTYGILSTSCWSPASLRHPAHVRAGRSDILFPVVRPLIFASLAFGSAFAATRSVDLIPILELIVGVAAGGAVLLPLLLIPAFVATSRRSSASLRMRKPSHRHGERPIRNMPRRHPSRSPTSRPRPWKRVCSTTRRRWATCWTPARTADELENRGRVQAPARGSAASRPTRVTRRPGGKPAERPRIEETPAC